jgi:hypothetical protein
MQPHPSAHVQNAYDGIATSCVPDHYHLYLINEFRIATSSNPLYIHSYIFIFKCKYSNFSYTQQKLPKGHKTPVYRTTPIRPKLKTKLPTKTTTTMVIGLLTLIAIPTVTGGALSVSEQRKANERKEDERRMAKFHVDVESSGETQEDSEVDGKRFVLRNNKV